MRPLILIAILLGLWTSSARAQCPAAIPAPADTFIVNCFTLGRSVDMRCATAIPPSICATLNTNAFNAGLLTQDGYDYLNAITFCAMVMDLGAGKLIYDFCPMGCFAADSKILTGVTPAAGASYAAASAVSTRSTLMSMIDNASLDDVILGPQGVKRIVYGPEDADLYVFTLANGSTLRVTQHHPMVLDNGKIIEAAKVTPQMSFVGLDGNVVAINAITREKPIGDVFNFETTGETELSHIIVAEGVLVGDLKIQNQLANEDGAIALRR